MAAFGSTNVREDGFCDLSNLVTQSELKSHLQKT